MSGWERWHRVDIFVLKSNFYLLLFIFHRDGKIYLEQKEAELKSSASKSLEGDVGGHEEGVVKRHIIQCEKQRLGQRLPARVHTQSIPRVRALESASFGLQDTLLA